jgi:HEAT repeat protein
MNSRDTIRTPHPRGIAFASTRLILAVCVTLSTACVPVCAEDDPSEALRQRFQERASAIPVGDIDAACELARWCEKNELWIERYVALRRVLKADPQNERANKDIGNIKYNGKWYDNDGLCAAKGMIRFEGKWILRTELKAKQIELEAYYLGERKKVIANLGDPVAVTRETARDSLETMAQLDDLPRICKYLESDDPDIRRNTVICLGRLGWPESVEILKRMALTDPDAETRRAAIVAVGKARTTAVMPFILERMEDPDPFTRRSAYDALRTVIVHDIGFKYEASGRDRVKMLDSCRKWIEEHRSESRAEWILTAFKAENPNVQKDACRETHLAMRQNVPAVMTLEAKFIDALLCTFSGTDVELRVLSVNALGRFKNNPRVLDAAKMALEDPKGDVRRAGIWALRDLMQETAPGDLCSVLTKFLETEKDEWTQADALNALAQIVQPAARPVFLQWLKTPGGGSRVTCSLCGLRNLRDYESLFEIQKLATCPIADVRDNVVEAYGMIGGRHLAYAIAPFVSDESPVVSVRAANWLMQFKMLSTCAPLVKGLRSADRDVRKKCFEALQEISGRKCDFRYDGTAEQRNDDAGEWERWWKKQDGKREK